MSSTRQVLQTGRQQVLLKTVCQLFNAR